MEKQVLKKLKKVADPELDISIIELGLIYNIEVKNNKVVILMTLTSPTCPYGQVLVSSVKKIVKTIAGIKSVRVNLTFNPLWSIDNASKAARLRIGL